MTEKFCSFLLFSSTLAPLQCLFVSSKLRSNVVIKGLQGIKTKFVKMEVRRFKFLGSNLGNPVGGPDFQKH